MTNLPPDESWKEHTTEFERVQAVATSLSQPRPAAYISQVARVDESDVRTHLEHLVQLAVLRKTERDGKVLYSSDPIYAHVQSIRDLVSEHDRSALVELHDELQSRVDDLESDGSASELDLARYRLGLLDAAIESYEMYTLEPLD